MAVRAHQRDHELADTLTMLRSRVGYNKFHQAASLLYLPSRVNLFSSTSWSEAARSPPPPHPTLARSAQVRLLRLLGARGAPGGTGRRHSQGKKPSHWAQRCTSALMESKPPQTCVDLLFDHPPGDSSFNLGERARMRRAGAKVKAAGRFSVTAGVAAETPPPEGSCDTAACYAAAAPSGTGSVELSLEA